MTTEPVLIERRERIGLMTLNRSEQLNTLTIPMLEAMEAVLTALEGDPDVRVIVITAAGERVFVAGGDIADLNSRGGLAYYTQFGETVHGDFRRFEVCDKPTIAAVNGWALGGGAEFLLTLDIRLIAEEAKLGLPEINLGLFPGGGGSQRLMRQIPLCQAKELMFVGEHLTAAEAVALGLCNRAVPRQRLLEEALTLARRIAEKSPLVLKLLKRAMLHGAEMPLGAALEYEQAMIGLVLESQDAHEGCNAFLEKRAPEFKGQ